MEHGWSPVPTQKPVFSLMAATPPAEMMALCAAAGAQKVPNTPPDANRPNIETPPRHNETTVKTSPNHQGRSFGARAGAPFGPKYL